MTNSPAMTRWEEESPGNVCGAARALTTLAPIPHAGVWRARLKFWIRRKLGPPGPLKQLSFIHFARTALIPRPGAGAYVYFESNFNGSFDTYIDAFSYVVPQHMRRIWQDADGFPGPTPATPFKRYIRSHDFPAAHFYSAYPGATATEVSAALTMKERLAPLAGAARDSEPEAFADRWHAVMREVPPPRGPGTSLTSLFRKRDPNVARDGQAYGLTVLSPVRRGRLRDLEAVLRQLPGCEDSPFANVPRTHFARLVLIDRYPFEEPPHLLFSCIIDGHPDSYLRSLCERIPDHVDAAWRHCEGAPEPIVGNPGAFQRWMRGNQIRTTTFFAPYGEATVEEVRDALELVGRTRELAYEMQYATPWPLQDEFLKRFVDPRTGRLR